MCFDVHYNNGVFSLPIGFLKVKWLLFCLYDSCKIGVMLWRLTASLKKQLAYSNLFRPGNRALFVSGGGPASVTSFRKLVTLVPGWNNCFYVTFTLVYYVLLLIYAEHRLKTVA